MKRSARKPAKKAAKKKVSRKGKRAIAAAPAGGRGAKKAPRKKNPTRRTRNDEGAAEILDQYESFHGRQARQLQEREEKVLVRTDFAKCGRLLDLTVWLDEDRPVVLTPKGVNVVTSGDGGSLYFQGGDQQLPLESLGLAEYLPKDYVRVGEVEKIAYHTQKGFHNFEPRDYEHEFGEEGGELPTLNYDTLNKLFFLTGGSYSVRPEGIVN
jgi:hypothetical protein